MSDLINRLREAQTNTNICNEAADALEAQAEEIEKWTALALPLKNYEGIIERQAKEIAELRECNGMLCKLNYKALCDQLGGQLTIALAYIPKNGFGYADCDAALEAWREL